MRNRNAAVPGAKMIRMTVEVGGYRWLVHGAFREKRFETHLVELRETIRLDVPVNQELRRKMREAIAKFLSRDVDVVKEIRADLFLIV